MKFLNVVLLAAGLAGAAIATSAAPLVIDPQQSKIEVAVSCTIDSFAAHLEKYDAAIDCDPAAALPARADVSFNFAALKTGSPDRDAAMLKWLEYDSHPTASFHLARWTKAGTTNIASGQLTIHGISVAVQLPVVVTQDGTGWDISGQTTFDYRDFRLPKIRKALLLTVDPKLTVKFHLAGKLTASK